MSRAAAVLVILAAAALAGCWRETSASSTAPAAAPPAPKVTVAPPAVRAATEWIELTGWTEAVESVEVRPRVTGYLDRVAFEEGAEVKKGDLLFVIDPRPYEAALQRAEAEVARLEARLELAKNDLSRAAKLVESRAISAEEYDQRSKLVREAEAALAAARAAVVTARLDVEFTQVRAPIDGKIGRRLVTPGNLVMGGAFQATLLATIVSVDPVHCYVDADERTTLRLRRRVRETGGVVKIPAELGLADEEGYPHEGEIDFLDNRLDPRTGTLRIRAVFPNADRRLAPGLFARVRIPAGPPAEALLVRESALGLDQGRRYLLVVGEGDKVERRSVEVGPLIGGERVIRSGLAKGERVIVNGLVRAQPGAKVDPVPEAPRPETASAR